MRHKMSLVASVMIVCGGVVVAGVARNASGAGAATVPTTIHGVNFMIQSQIDVNYCIQIDNGTQEGRALTLQQCQGQDTIRWALTDNADDTNFIVDSQGMCVDGHFKKANLGLSVTVAKCQTGRVWRFAYTGVGQLMDVQNKKCLSVPGAAANAMVSLQPCDQTMNGQMWRVTH